MVSIVIYLLNIDDKEISSNNIIDIESLNISKREFIILNKHYAFNKDYQKNNFNFLQPLIEDEHSIISE